MKIKKYLNIFTVAALLLCLLCEISDAQTNKYPAPRRETLLNDLNLLVWNAPNAETVTVKLRINKGAAFDQQGKEGTMTLLSNVLFPSEISRDFFREDLGGNLEITSSYDYIQLTATARSEKVLDVLQTLANAVINPQTDKETTKIVRAAQIEKVKKLESNSSYVADQAVAKRLFGDFPYGRAAMGTSESLQKIDFADLIFAKNKFLTSDNATLVVYGNVKSDLIYKAARRYFGSWVKSDDKIPATFRLPDAPDTSTEVIYLPSTENTEIRSAARGLARNGKDFPASQILLQILNEKWSAVQTEGTKQNAFVRDEAHYLPGIFIVGASVPAAETDVYLKKNASLIDSLNSFTNADFDRAKASVISQSNSNLANLDNLSDLWLDAETFKLNSVGDQMKALQNVTFADVKRVAEKFLSKNQRVTVVVSEKSAETKTQSDK